MKYNHNFDEYEKTLKALIKIKAEIKNSNHDSLASEDYDPSDEEVQAWCESLNLPRPSSFSKSIVHELPEEYLVNIFYKDTATEAEYNEVMNSDVYKLMFKIYSNVYEEMYEAATEESAYYMNEYEEMESYYDSVRRMYI